MENKLSKVAINGTTYFKSKYSEKSKYCVGVSFCSGKYRLINTNEGKTTVEFTEQEWDIFLKAVKSGDFDDLKSLT